jgi:hypothetical protein
MSLLDTFLGTISSAVPSGNKKTKSSKKKAGENGDILDGITDQVKARALKYKDLKLRGSVLNALISDTIVENVVDNVEERVRDSIKPAKKK